MQERNLYVPTSYIEQENRSPVIFLAGPIQGAVDWQSKAIELIHSIRQNVVIASPRRNNPPETFNYLEQVNWETHHLRRAGKNGVLLFWLAREHEHDCSRTYAQTTRAELFEWKVKHEIDKTKMVLGIEEGFSGARYIRHRFSQDCRDIPIFDDLKATCFKAVELVY